MPTLLEDSIVADALTALSDWSGDAQRITRSVEVSGDALDALLADVQETADSMNHHPGVERSDSGVTFTLTTHSAGGVTEYDIALASRIDDLVSKATGKGVVAGAPTTAGQGGGETGTGEREAGAPPADVEIPTGAAETAEGNVDPVPSDADQAEPLVGAPSARGTPAVPLPDTVPNEPQPGVARPAGQGTPPAGQHTGDAGPDDHG